MMPLIAILVVFGSLMSLDQSRPESWTVIFVTIGTVLTILGIAVFFLIDEVPIRTEENQNNFANIFLASLIALGALFLALIPLFEIYP